MPRRPPTKGDRTTLRSHCSLITPSLSESQEKQRRTLWMLCLRPNMQMVLLHRYNFSGLMFDTSGVQRPTKRKDHGDSTPEGKKPKIALSIRQAVERQHREEKEREKNGRRRRWGKGKV